MTYRIYCVLKYEMQFTMLEIRTSRQKEKLWGFIHRYQQSFLRKTRKIHLCNVALVICQLESLGYRHPEGLELILYTGYRRNYNKLVFI